MSMDLSWKIGVRIRPYLQLHRGSAITFVNHMHSVVCIVISVSILYMCGLLPYTIKSKCHIHPLILTKRQFLVLKMIKIQEDCEPNKFYCDACEEERDPLLPIYYCAECDFYCYMSRSVPLKM
jgi:hypothetical protein